MSTMHLYNCICSPQSVFSENILLPQLLLLSSLKLVSNTLLNFRFLVVAVVDNYQSILYVDMAGVLRSLISCPKPTIKGTFAIEPMKRRWKANGWRYVCIGAFARTRTCVVFLHLSYSQMPISHLFLQCFCFVLIFSLLACLICFRRKNELAPLLSLISLALFSRFNFKGGVCKMYGDESMLFSLLLWMFVSGSFGFRFFSYDSYDSYFTNTMPVRRPVFVCTVLKGGYLLSLVERRQQRMKIM